MENTNNNKLAAILEGLDNVTMNSEYKVMVRFGDYKTSYSHSILGILDVKGKLGGKALVTICDSYDNKKSKIVYTFFIDEFGAYDEKTGEFFHKSEYSLKFVNVAEQAAKEAVERAEKEVAEKEAEAARIELEALKAELAAAQAELLAKSKAAASKAKSKAAAASK